MEANCFCSTTIFWLQAAVSQPPSSRFSVTAPFSPASCAHAYKTPADYLFRAKLFEPHCGHP